MKIKLGRRETNAYALIDPEDYDLVWNYDWHQNNAGYAVSSVRQNGRRVYVRMHRLIMNPPDDLLVDHINGNTIDNRRSNLRICNTSENVKNRVMQKRNKVGEKNISVRKSGRFEAGVISNGIRHRKMFDNLADAKKYVHDKRIELHGEFANHGYSNAV